MSNNNEWRIEKCGRYEVRITAPEDLEETLAKYSVHLEDVISVLTPHIAAALAQPNVEMTTLHSSTQMAAEVGRIVEQTIEECIDKNEGLLDLLNENVKRMTGGRLSGNILTRDDLIKAMKSNFAAGGEGLEIPVIQWNHSHGHKENCDHSHN